MMGIHSTLLWLGNTECTTIMKELYTSESDEHYKMLKFSILLIKTLWDFGDQLFDIVWQPICHLYGETDLFNTHFV